MASPSSKKTIVYLAAPYSHPDKEVREARFLAVNNVAGKLMSKGVHIFSPITHGHPMALAVDLPTDWRFWESYCRAMLDTCCELIVLKLPGWEQSKGVSGEIEYAESIGIPVKYMETNAFGQVAPDSVDFWKSLRDQRDKGAMTA